MPRIDALLRAGIQAFRRSAPGYPPPEFRGRTRSRARPVPARPDRRDSTPPPAPRISASAASAPAALARRLGVMAALARRSPVALVPEQLQITSVGHHVVDHRRRLEAVLSPAGDAQRVACQVCSPRPPPAGAVASARRARPLPIQVALDLRRAPHPRWTVHGRLRGQRRLRTTKPAAAMPGGLIDDWRKLMSALAHLV